MAKFKVGQFVHLTCYEETNILGVPVWCVIAEVLSGDEAHADLLGPIPSTISLRRSREWVYLDDDDELTVHDAIPDDIWAAHVAWRLTDG